MKGRSRESVLCGRIQRDQLFVIRETIGANRDTRLHTVHDHSEILHRVRAVA